MRRARMVCRRKPMSPEEKAGKKGCRARSGGFCERCGRRPGQEVHHRKNRSQGGTWALSNLMDLCSECHREVTSLKTVALEQGWSVLREHDPAKQYVWLAGRGYCFLSDAGEISDAQEEAS
jgi:5-methylcytosine-specific restriction endonuclease McrA